MQINLIVKYYQKVKFEFVCMDGAPLKMSEVRGESATGDSVRVKSHDILADNQSQIMAIVLSERQREGTRRAPDGDGYVWDWWSAYVRTSISFCVGLCDVKSCQNWWIAKE